MISVIKIVEDTTVDGPGFRTTVYAAGCPNACPGCHNPQSWDIGAGILMTTEEIMQVIRADEFADVTFSGGDPMFQPEGFAELAEAVKRETGKNIWCYTGYKFERLLHDRRQLNCCNTLMCWWTGHTWNPYATVTRCFAVAATNG